jgi:hypothetical protein
MWLEKVLEELKGSHIQDPMLQMIFGPFHFRLLQQIEELQEVQFVQLSIRGQQPISTTDPSPVLPSHH